MIQRKPILVPRKLNSVVKNPYGYIYITINKINYKCYIGKHSSKKLDKSYLGSGAALKRAINKYGKENFVSEPIDWAESKEKLDQKEIWWIDFLGAVESNQFYNEIYGGTGYSGGENHPLYGKSMPEFQRQRIRETSPHISGKNHPMYGDHRFAGENNPMYGKSGKLSPTYGRKMSDEDRKKMSKNHADVSGGKNPASKSVVRLSLNNELLEVYDFLGKVTIQGFGEESVRNCCKKRKSQYKGYKWMYKEEYEKSIKEMSKCQQM